MPYLGGDGLVAVFERRVDTRQRICTCVYHRPGMGLVRTKSQTVDISPHGMMIRTSEPLPVGVELNLDIEVVRPRRVQFSSDSDALMVDGPPVVEEYHIRGRVQRCTTDDGSWLVGVVFADVDEQHQSAFDQYLRFMSQDEHIF